MAVKCDVLVVGAGPAGASAAFFLKYFDRKDEFNVKLVERLPWRQYYTYHRMCGEAISKRAFRELRPLEPTHIIERVISHNEIYPGGITIATKQPGFILNCPLFLRNIIRKFEKRGGTYIQGKTVSDIIQKKKKILANIDKAFEKFDYVIAADGINSVVRMKVGVPKGLSVAAIQYVVRKKVPKDKLTFVCDEIYNGNYAWIFPNGSTTKIGFPLIPNKNFKPDGKILKKQVRFIGFGGIEKYTVGRILLVGDAAYQANPITKGGIRPAMVAGKEVAKAIIKKDPECYSKMWKNSCYSNRRITKAFNQLKKLNNRQFISLINQIKKNNLKKSDLQLVEVIKHCNVFGW